MTNIKIKISIKNKLSQGQSQTYLEVCYWRFCFPKGVKTFWKIADECGYEELITAVEEVIDVQKSVITQ